MSSNKKAQRVMVIAGVAGVLLIGGVALAASGKKKPKKADDGASKDETIVIPPGQNGIPDGSAPPIIVLPPKTAPSLPSKEPAFIPSTPPESEEQDGASFQPAKLEVKVGPAVMESTNNVFPMPPLKTEEQKAVAAVIDTIAPGVKPLPIALAETKADMDPKGTIALARMMLGRETLPNWKEDLKGEITAWQAKVGLKPDGKFGVLSVSKMAEEVGILPLVRVWSTSHKTKNAALTDYQEKVLSVATKLQQFLPGSRAHILALGESVKRETGLTFGANPGPNPTMIQVQKINDTLAAQAQAEGKQEMNA